MHLSALTHLPVIAGAKLLLVAASPLQSLVDKPGITHEFCNKQALSILRDDGHVPCAEFFERYITELNAGVYWADTGWKNVSHYFEPTSGKGLWQFPSAADEFERYAGKAALSVQNGNYPQAVFFLGAATHLVQDVCVPHHARGKLFCGHQEYENWVQQHHTNYAVAVQGIYNEGLKGGMWLLNNAVVAADLLDWVTADNREAFYHKATTILLPRAQRSTAGLFQQFFATMACERHRVGRLGGVTVA